MSERERIREGTLERLLNAIDSEDAVLVELPFDRHVAEALREVDRTQVPDLPDRIIAATAVRMSVPLISRDRKIQLAGVNTLW